MLVVQFREAETDPGVLSAAAYNEWTGDVPTCSRDAILGGRRQRYGASFSRLGKWLMDMYCNRVAQLQTWACNEARRNQYYFVFSPIHSA